MKSWGGRRLALLYTIDENPTFYEGQAEVVAADFAALGGDIGAKSPLRPLPTTRP